MSISILRRIKPLTSELITIRRRHHDRKMMENNQRSSCQIEPIPSAFRELLILQQVTLMISQQWAAWSKHVLQKSMRQHAGCDQGNRVSNCRPRSQLVKNGKRLELMKRSNSKWQFPFAVSCWYRDQVVKRSRYGMIKKRKGRQQAIMKLSR